MIRTWSLFIAVVLFSASCKKKEEVCPVVMVAAPASEVAALKAYLDANSITATADTRGFYYIITNAGAATKPTVCKTVTVAYTGKLTSGSTFDSNANATFPLSNLIIGWQEGIPLIGTGGSITLYLPPSLAYGSQGRPGIPANSILIFTIELKAIL